MQPEDKLSLPFITRKMLAFEFATRFAIRVEVQASVASQLTIRCATKEGISTFKVITTSDGSLVSNDFNLPDIPFFVSVKEGGSAYAQGRCHATVTLLANDDPLYEVCSGFIYEQKGISYPQTTIFDRRPNGGAIRSVASANPAAGSEISFAVPINFTWKIIGIQFTLVTDANVANRRVHIVLPLSGFPEFNIFNDVDQTASLTRKYTCAGFGTLPSRSDDNDILLPLPRDIILTQGQIIATQTTNFQATDDFSTCNVMVEEYFQQ